MKPQDDYRNGDGQSHSSDSEGSSEALEDELSLDDKAAPVRTLAALNALRKSRQHFDVVVVAEGAEVPAHRAVLAAASPFLLEALAEPGAALRVDDVGADALRALVEYAYTGRLRVRDAADARRLYRAAWRLRMDAVRAPLAERLLRRPAPADCLELRSLPALEPAQRAALDAYIAQHLDEVCAAGALAALPLLRLELLRESSVDDGEEAPRAVAEAVLVWLRAQLARHDDLDELCSRTHLLFVDGDGALRDCGELPAARGDGPELNEYRREAAERETRRGAARGAETPTPTASADAECAVVAARGHGERATRALLALRGRLAALRVAWRTAPGGGPVARGGPLGGAREREEEAARAELPTARCAHGTAALDGRLIVCGGYDRARVLRTAAAYDPVANAWSPLPDMRSARARFPAARLGGRVYVLGGSDGHAELDSVDAYAEDAWQAQPKMPLARSHAAAVAVEERGELYVIGGWAAGLSVKRVHRYSPADGGWAEAAPLCAGRSQCAAVLWAGALWVLGGCDAWRCLASTETLALPPAVSAAWAPGPPLPTARRSVGGAVWRSRLVSVGGSDGAASLRRTDWLLPGGGGWLAGPGLRRARAALGLAVLDDVLYAVGGYSGKEFLSCVECLYEPDGEWTTLCAPPPPRPLPSPHSPHSPDEDGSHEM